MPHLGIIGEQPLQGDAFVVTDLVGRA